MIIVSKIVNLLSGGGAKVIGDYGLQTRNYNTNLLQGTHEAFT